MKAGSGFRCRREACLWKGALAGAGLRRAARGGSPRGPGARGARSSSRSRLLGRRRLRRPPRGKARQGKTTQRRERDGNDTISRGRNETGRREATSVVKGRHGEGIKNDNSIFFFFQTTRNNRGGVRQDKRAENWKKIFLYFNLAYRYYEKAATWLAHGSKRLNTCW